MAAVVNVDRISDGSFIGVAGVALDQVTTDPTPDGDGALWYNSTSDKLKLRAAGSTVALAHAAVATGAPSATAAPTFTGTTPTAAVNPTALFSGTGQSSSGQVITTTDNQTMTL